MRAFGRSQEKVGCGFLDLLIAQALLHAEHGKLKPTGKPGHHSMWLRAAALGMAPSLFEVIQ